MERRTDLLEILQYIDPAMLDYQDWINVGMALKAEGYDCSAWDAWSQADGRRYHPGDCTRKWESFRGSSTPITGGTIDYCPTPGAEPVRLSVLYLCLMFRRRSDRAVLVRPPQKLRTCFYAMIQPEMVKLRPIRLLERHARAVSAAVQSLHQSYVRHDGIFRGQITRHRQRRQKSAAVPAACALGSAPVSAAIAATGITDSSRQSTSSRQSHLCVFFIPFPP